MKTIEVLLKVWRTVEVPDENAKTLCDIEDYLSENNKWPSLSNIDSGEWTQEVLI